MQPLTEKAGDNRAYMSRHELPDDGLSLFGRWARHIRRTSRAIVGVRLSRILLSPVTLKAVAVLSLFGVGTYLFQEDRIGGEAFASVIANSGLTVENLIVTGTNELDPVIVEEHLSPMFGTSILTVDAELARSRVTEISWVKNASVKKAYPDTLVVDLIERRPVALWKSEGVLFLISPDGFVIDEAGLEHMHLPQVVGEGANEVASEFLSGIDQFSGLVKRADAYVRVASRRWDLMLDNGLRVLLPADGWRESLLELQKMQDERQILDRKIVQIDMRLPDRVVLRLEEGAAEDRRLQIEEISKQGGRET